MKKTVYAAAALFAVLALVFAGCQMEAGNPGKNPDISRDIKVSVQFDPAHSLAEIDEIELNAGKSLGDQFPAAPEREGYIFLGWFNDDTQYTAETVIEESITLVAKWLSVDEITVSDWSEIGEAIKAVLTDDEWNALWAKVEPAYFAEFFNAEFNSVFDKIVDAEVIDINAAISAKHVENFNAAYSLVFDPAYNAAFNAAFDAKYAELFNEMAQDEMVIFEYEMIYPEINGVREIAFDAFIHLLLADSRASIDAELRADDSAIRAVAAAAADAQRETLSANALAAATAYVLGDFATVKAKALADLGYSSLGWGYHTGTYHDEYMKLWDSAEMLEKRMEYRFNGLTLAQKTLVLKYTLL